MVAVHTEKMEKTFRKNILSNFVGARHELAPVILVLLNSRKTQNIEKEHAIKAQGDEPHKKLKPSCAPRKLPLYTGNTFPCITGPLKQNVLGESMTNAAEPCVENV